MIAIPYEDYAEASESNQGWCTFCKSFTNDFAEPDAQNYTCDVCGNPTVFGAEQALLTGLITFRP